MPDSELQHTIDLLNISSSLAFISEKVISGNRITPEEGLNLYQTADLGFLGLLSNFIRDKKNGNDAYFNKNFHVEPTNICIYRCKFCLYSRKMNEEGSWQKEIDDIVDMAKAYQGKDVTEVHIVGGVHPDRDLSYYAEMVNQVDRKS